jgi:hypothetical protein
MFMKRAGGLAAGTLFCWMFLHATTAFAFGLKAKRLCKNRSRPGGRRRFDHRDGDDQALLRGFIC